MVWKIDVEQLIERFKVYLEERWRSGIKLDDKAITSEKTIQTYVKQLKWLLYNC